MPEEDDLLCEQWRAPPSHTGHHHCATLPITGGCTGKRGVWRGVAGDWRGVAGDWRGVAGDWRGVWRGVAGVWRGVAGEWRGVAGVWESWDLVYVMLQYII